MLLRLLSLKTIILKLINNYILQQSQIKTYNLCLQIKLLLQNKNVSNKPVYISVSYNNTRYFNFDILNTLHVSIYCIYIEMINEHQLSPGIAKKILT